jgi:hypothetical protein
LILLVRLQDLKLRLRPTEIPVIPMMVAVATVMVATVMVDRKHYFLHYGLLSFSPLEYSSRGQILHYPVYLA